MNPLIVRLEVDAMRASILHAFAARHDELEQMLAQEVDRAIANFDFEHEVQVVAHKLLGEIVESAIRDVLYQVLWSEPARDQFEEMARAVVAQLFSSSSKEK